MKTIKHIKKLLLVGALLCSSIAMSSCKDGDSGRRDPALPAIPKISLASSSPVFYNTTESWLQIRVDGDWKLTVQCLSEGEPWCSVNPTSGVGNKNVVLTTSKNEEDESRVAMITLENNGSSTQFELIQLDPSQGDIDNPPTPIEPGGVSPDKVISMDKIPTTWMELPATDKKFGNSAVVSHDVLIGAKSVRNFTMLYDTVQMVAYWVAYPIASIYNGSQKRTDKWAYDPKVPFAYQPTLTSGFPQQEAGKNKYDRGHQMPSADRTANFNANAQTFYFTNMTAQTWQFNQRIWKNLEDKVRNWSAIPIDTLYVVTGAYLGSPIEYTKDKAGKNVAIPKNYYKVLLARTNPDTYKAIGFWFENKPYDDNTVSSKYAKTVADIETLTGQKFFINLPQATREQVIKQYSPQSWPGLPIQ